MTVLYCSDLLQTHKVTAVHKLLWLYLRLEAFYLQPLRVAPLLLWIGMTQHSLNPKIFQRYSKNISIISYFEVEVDLQYFFSFLFWDWDKRVSPAALPFGHLCYSLYSFQSSYKSFWSLKIDLHISSCYFEDFLASLLQTLQFPNLHIFEVLKIEHISNWYFEGSFCIWQFELRFLTCCYLGCEVWGSR